MQQNRRHFLKTTATVTAAGLFIPLSEVAAQEMEYTKAKAGYELLFMATDWGFDGTVDEFCEAAKKEGYEGIETWWPADNSKAQGDLFAALKKHDLQVGFLCGGSQSDVTAHLNIFKKNLDAATANDFQKPVYINCHSGKDYFNYDQNKLFIDYTTKKSKETGIPIYHETHRGRMLYSAPITRNFIENNPDLRLTLDISHWCVVHESLLADQKDTIDMILEKVSHIHSRVGHPQGAQVNDPRAPEWEGAIKAHVAWWDSVIARKKLKGERMTILTEFGPPDYLQTLPYTRQPVADQWAINVYMMNLLRKRYQL
ncbi:sugar phosphate isomerase/epimerase family protein [Pedobacter psychroterrae]|uniref:Twin-arginine translocation signal domain-containing protein n=1 Tax=Pedobacter psychroterrae TaxID=2530453 RepID=A0A4R0NJY0_9SPHI|nr:twin-arginine translocation signal domain-containing protein [Pedobacter psychroterrae]TCD00846.1 twin-arginine translocation signal domain-containing protein [Pedobacter psychroterrae]